MNIFFEMRLAARYLARTPGVSLLLVGTLTLTIAFASASFSIVDAKCLRPLLYGSPERLVIVWKIQPKGGRTNVSLHDFFALKATGTRLEAIAPIGVQQLTLRSSPPVELGAAKVTREFFQVVKVKPFLGRTFTEEEGASNQSRVVILSYNIWKNHLGGDLSILGKEIVLDGKPWTVIGVMPPAFTFLRANAIWIPLGYEPLSLQAEMRNSLILVGRLRPGATIDAANAEAGLIFQNANMSDGGPGRKWSALVRPLRYELIGQQAPFLWILFAATLLIVLVAVANVANVKISQLAKRGEEIAVRLSLGASHGKLLKLFVLESLPISSLGSVLGFLMASTLARYFNDLEFLQAPGLQQIHVTWRLAAFTFVLFILISLCLAALAVRQTNEKFMQMVLRSGSNIRGPLHYSTRQILVGCQIALSVILLSGSLLLSRSFFKLEQVPLGFVPRHLHTMRISLPRSRYTTETAVRSFFDTLLAKARATPGVQSADLAATLPLLGWANGVEFRIEGQQSSFDASNIANHQIVSGGYFRTMSIPVIKGRALSETDTATANHVAIINESLERKCFPNENPVGKHLTLQLSATEHPLVEVVGVVADVKDLGIEDAPTMEIYTPYTQTITRSAYIIIRSERSLTDISASIRNIIAHLDGDQAVADVDTMSHRIYGSIADRELYRNLLSIFAFISFFLSLSATLGLVYFFVADRGPELALRLALGSSRMQIIHFVVKRGLVLVCMGCAVGSLLSVTLAGLLRTTLFGVSNLDPVSLSVPIVLIIISSLVVLWFPSARAANTSPLRLLRRE